MARNRFSSNTVRTIGALLPSDVFEKIRDGERLDGLSPDAYRLDAGVRLRDVVAGVWGELLPLWWGLQRELNELPESDAAATALTREKWLLPLLAALGFDDIELQSGAIEVGGTAYPVSHVYSDSPVHLMGARTELDTRVAGVPGAARMSPHSLVQQFLNRSDDHLWGIVTNGNKLRLLRDSVSLTRQAFVEFDLAAMFSGEVYTDFNLMYRTIHATRFEGERPEDCLLESWVRAAREDGTRARDQLRDGVQTAIEKLGTGFLAHPNNDALRESVASGETTESDLYKYLLRLIYRLLFLFVAEDRDLLHPEGTSPDLRDRYLRFYSTSRLRELSTKPVVGRHDDLWHGLSALMDVLAKDEGEADLGLPGLGSFLWQQDTIGALRGSSIDNQHLLIAVHHLSHTQQDKTVRKVDYTQLGAEELGSIYESLLELHPTISDSCSGFTLDGAAGSERKTTGSYYTPTTLISELLETALDPVLDRAANASDPETAILDLKIVDPACGSGHFLLAAATRVAKRLAEIRTGEPEPNSDAQRTALREVVSRCIYGVDFNDLAVELCKVSLWIETLEPGKPLSFLDHHIRVGNSLFGATPSAIEGGIPSAAFDSLTGDDSAVVTQLKARNTKELKANLSALTFGAESSSDLASEIEALEEFSDTDLATVRVKESMLADWRASKIYRQQRLIADAWCAAFAIQKSEGSPPLTAAVFDGLRSGSINPELAQTIDDLRSRYRFFHWHVEFPQVFTVKDSGTREGGFDVVLGNPPWERVKLQQKEFFSASDPEIAKAPNKAKRQALIDQLPKENPGLWDRYEFELRSSEALSHHLRESGLFPLCGRGDVNTYTVFTELMRSLLGATGRAGVIVPSGIATDDTTKHFFADIVEERSLHSLYDFENRKKIFSGIDSRIKFCLLTITGPSDPVDEAEFVFFALDVADLADPDRRFILTSEDFALLNPNTRTCPVFRTKRDAEITKAIYRRVPVLIDENKPDGNPWEVKFSTMFHMSGASHLFKTREELEADGWSLQGNHFIRGNKTYLPLFEAKMAWFFDHRAADVVISETALVRQGQPSEIDSASKEDPLRAVIPRSWVPEEEVLSKDAGMGTWIGAWRKVTSPSNERTFCWTVLPIAGVGDNLLLSRTDSEHGALLPAIGGSFVVDFVARQKLGGVNFQFYIAKQLPFVKPASVVRFSALLKACSTELSFTSWDMGGFAADLGYSGPPFRWDDSRRPLLRAEIDAAMFHLYEIERGDVEYIMETFPIVRGHDIAEHGSFRTKELILDAYDRMTDAEEAGVRYETRIDPPPADPSLAHTDSSEGTTA